MRKPSNVFATVRARPGRLSTLSVSHSNSGLYEAFVWARRALNRQKRRFPARAGHDKGNELLATANVKDQAARQR